MLPHSLWLLLPRVLLGFPLLLRVQQGSPGYGGDRSGHLSHFLPVALGVVTPTYGEDAAGGHGAGRLSGSCRWEPHAPWGPSLLLWGGSSFVFFFRLKFFEVQFTSHKTHTFQVDSLRSFGKCVVRNPPVQWSWSLSLESLCPSAVPSPAPGHHQLCSGFVVLPFLDSLSAIVSCVAF